MVSLDEMIKGAWIEGGSLFDDPFGKMTVGPKFIEQLANFLAELHKSSYEERKPFAMWSVVEGLVSWDDKDRFCEDALCDFYAIKSELTGNVSLHGDIWRQNILIDKERNLNGLRDWETLSIGDPHWDFRMIRRWIGWDGLDKLLFLYNNSVNWSCKREYIEILDRISLCHSLRTRKEGWRSRHDKPDTIELFEKCIKMWPIGPYVTDPIEAIIAYKKYIKK